MTTIDEEARARALAALPQLEVFARHVEAVAQAKQALLASGHTLALSCACLRPALDALEAVALLTGGPASPTATQVATLQAMLAEAERVWARVQALFGEPVPDLAGLLTTEDRATLPAMVQH